MHTALLVGLLVLVSLLAATVTLTASAVVLRVPCRVCDRAYAKRWHTATSFRICTVNLFSGMGSRTRPRLERELRRVGSPDCVFVQEALDREDMRRVAGYALHEDDEGVGEHRRGAVALLLRRGSPWGVVASEAVDSTLCSTARRAALYTLRESGPGGLEVRVANVHLCGGREDDAAHAADAPRRMRRVKAEVVRRAVRGGADLVLGDFNSDRAYASNAAYRAYKAARGWGEAQMREWNLAPHRALARRGFRSVPARGPTSFFGGTPDAVWYRARRLELTGWGVVDMGAARAASQGEAASDHDGISADFAARPNMLGHPPAAIGRDVG